MISALKEYNEMVFKPLCKWMLGHWMGYLLFVAFCIAGYYIWFYRSDIKRFIKSKFKRNKEES